MSAKTTSQFKQQLSEELRPVTAGPRKTFFLAHPVPSRDGLETDMQVAHAFQLQVSPLMFVHCWWLTVLAHLADMSFLIGTMYLYHWFLYGGPHSRYLLSAIAMDLDWSTLDILSWGFIVFAALHAMMLGRTLWASMQMRQLVFNRPFRSTKSLWAKLTMSKQLSTNKAFHPGHRLFTKAEHAYETIMIKYIRPIVSIDGEYFDQYFLIEECIEVVSQIYQSYRSSWYISTRWINNLMVTMIFINCVSTPVIYWLIPATKTPLRRLVSVIVSSILNFINSVMIPVIIFIPYVQAYDPTTKYFPRELIWDDVWWVKAISENEQILVTSYLDYVTSLVPHWVILNCLHVCESMLQRRSNSVGSTAAIVPSDSGSSNCNQASPTLKPQSSPSTKAKPNSCKRVRNKIENMLYFFLVFLGFVVAGIHIISQSTRKLAGCRLHATPWLGHNSSCTVMNINCHSRGISGSQSEIDTILTQLSSDTLVTLLLTHCRDLQIPPSLRDMKYLQGLEIYNSTLRQWDASAAVRHQELGALTTIAISRSVISSIPPGLLDVDMASMALEMIFFETNLTSLPPTVLGSWSSVWSFWCVSCHMTQLPNQLSLSQLMLIDNPLTTIDSDLFANDEMYKMDLSATSIASFPSNTSSNLDSLSHLFLEYTNLSDVPLYIRQWFTDGPAVISHSLYGSPYCLRELGDDEEQKRYQQQVCAEDHHRRTDAFPIAFIIPQRPL